MVAKTEWGDVLLGVVRHRRVYVSQQLVEFTARVEARGEGVYEGFEAVSALILRVHRG